MFEYKEKMIGESSKAFSYFLEFIKLPVQKRSLSNLATQLGKSLQTLKQLSSRFSWSDRADSFDRAQDRLSIEAIKAAHKAELELFKIKRLQVANEIYETSSAYLSKLKEHVINELQYKDFSKLTPDQCAVALKNASIVAQTAMDEISSALLVEDLCLALDLVNRQD